MIVQPEMVRQSNEPCQRSTKPFSDLNKSASEIILLISQFFECVETEVKVACVHEKLYGVY